MAVFMTRSIDWTVVAWQSLLSACAIAVKLGPPQTGGEGISYINNATQGADGIGAVDGVGAAAGILHDGAGDHDDVLGGAGELLDDEVNHLAQAGILVLEELRDAEEERGRLSGGELLARVEEEGDLGEEDTASSRLDGGDVEEAG